MARSSGREGAYGSEVLERSNRKPGRLGIALVRASAMLTVAVLVFIIGYVMARGAKMMTPGFLFGSPEKMGREGGIFPSIVGTVVLTLSSVLIAAPLGIGTAVFLTEYTREGLFSRIVRFGTESLAGIPSIIFGLFGFLFFVIRLGMGWSILSGSLTLAAMMLPTIVRTSEEALRSVPDVYKETAYALGASRWQTVTSVVLPTATPGIATGVVLAMGRAVGETAAVIFTAGSSLRLPKSIFDPVRTLPVHFYILAREGISIENAYGTAAVLLTAVLLVDFAAYYILHRVSKRRPATGR
ncbi:MAG: phosphate ABC transporter permease PstA [Firmicutes bacterium]|jgi:phosphate transport system permease protein|nr:phosphate ABC transporter permease PstA [Candidatus Fermentithermobacillaceae bacterium]